MRAIHRSQTLLVSAALLTLGACTGGPSSKAPAARPSGEMLVLDRSSGLEAIDPSTGSLLFQARGTPIQDWSHVVSATPSGASTLLRETEPMSGRITSSMTVQGRFAVGAVSADGSDVALVPPTPAGSDAWTPVDRSSTTVVVAHPQAGSTKTYRLHGNFVPEAFSTDDSGLFMLEYLPPVEPTAYRVVRLTLDKGKVEELYGRTKGVEPPKRMAGTRLQQIPAPDGSELYTLYTNQSPVYAKEYATETHESGPVAFIHTLSLQDGWAYCLDLPKGFGPGPSSAKAIALSPDGTELYAVDTDRGLLAVLNTGSLKVVRSADVAFHLPDGGQTVASVSSDGKDLYVARGSQVETVSLASLTTAGGWTLNGTATGLASSEDGNRLYASTSNGLQVLDPSTGGSLRSLSLSGVSGIAYVGSTGS